MPKTNKTQAQIFTCFNHGWCPYCGTNDVKLEGTKKGYHALCNVCKAQASFTNEKVIAWKGGLV